MRMLQSVVVVVLSALVAAPSCNPPRADLEFTVKSEKQAFILGERPELLLGIRNVSTSMVAVSTLPSTFVEEVLVRKDGRKVSVHQSARSWERRSLDESQMARVQAAAVRVLAPGEEVEVPFGQFEVDFGLGEQLMRQAAGVPTDMAAMDEGFSSGTPRGVIFRQVRLPPSVAGGTIPFSQIPLVGLGNFSIQAKYHYRGPGGSGQHPLARGPFLSNTFEFTIQ